MRYINPINVLSVIGIALGVAGAYIGLTDGSALVAVSLLIPSVLFLGRARILIDENRYRRLLDLMDKEFPIEIKTKET